MLLSLSLKMVITMESTMYIHILYMALISLVRLKITISFKKQRNYRRYLQTVPFHKNNRLRLMMRWKDMTANYLDILRIILDVFVVKSQAIIIMHVQINSHVFIVQEMIIIAINAPKRQCAINAITTDISSMNVQLLQAHSAKIVNESTAEFAVS